jgi:hypothetical protein
MSFIIIQVFSPLYVLHFEPLLTFDMAVSIRYSKDTTSIKLDTEVSTKLNTM